MTAKPFNVRVDDKFREQMDRFVKQDGCRTASQWAREALGVVMLLGGLEAARLLLDERMHGPHGAPSGGPEPRYLTPHPPRSLALQASTQGFALSGECLHPPTALKQLPFTKVCKLCGATVS